MPELPEVETTRRGIAPHITAQSIKRVVVRESRLRWPIPATLPAVLRNQTIQQVNRRGKYLLLNTGSGVLIIHLGMSGSLRVVAAASPPRPHDHVDILLGDRCLRYHDPRRFGLVLWTAGDPLAHPLLGSLGPEPLGAEFTAEYLYLAARRRHAAVKALIMDARVVVGVGHIYANESLFAAGIHPLRRAARISARRYALLVDCIRVVLSAAISEGGTTLRDFVHEDGEPGYFAQSLRVYGRAGEDCRQCGGAIRHSLCAQRSTYYCSRCQR